MERVQAWLKSFGAGGSDGDVEVYGMPSPLGYFVDTSDGVQKIESFVQATNFAILFVPVQMFQEGGKEKYIEGLSS